MALLRAAVTSYFIRALGVHRCFKNLIPVLDLVADFICYPGSRSSSDLDYFPRGAFIAEFATPIEHHSAHQIPMEGRRVYVLSEIFHFQILIISRFDIFGCRSFVI